MKRPINPFRPLSEVRLRNAFHGALQGFGGAYLFGAAFTNDAANTFQQTWNAVTGAAGVAMLGVPVYLAIRHKGNISYNALKAFAGATALTFGINHVALPLTMPSHPPEKTAPAQP